MKGGIERVPLAPSQVGSHTHAVKATPEDANQAGPGSRLMNDLIAEADEKQLPLSLHVEHDNPAMGLYERLGFNKGELRGVYYFMERPPAPEAIKS